MEEWRTGTDRRAVPRGTDRRKPGRPSRVEGEASSERISIWLTPSERDALEQAALANGQSPCDLVREAVNEYVADFSERGVFRAG